MRAYEIIVESTKDSFDILTLAKFLADNIEKFIKKAPYYTVFTLEDISRILRIKIPKTHSNEIKNILINKYKFKLDNKIELAQHRAFIDRETSDYPGYIVLNIKNLIDNARLEPGIAHEMRHAIDNVKSVGKNNSLTTQNVLDTRTYLNLQNEINARFTEVLVHLVKATPSKETLEPIISILFNMHLLNRSIFPKNQQGQKQYNRLFSRAYKFYDELSKLSKVDKTTWWDKVKTLINKFKLT
jgi:hypothetical protein